MQHIHPLLQLGLLRHLPRIILFIIKMRVIRVRSIATPLAIIRSSKAAPPRATSGSVRPAPRRGRTLVIGFSTGKAGSRPGLSEFRERAGFGGGGGVLVVVVCAGGRMGEDFVGFDDFAEAVYWDVWGVVWVVLFYEEGVTRFYFLC